MGATSPVGPSRRPEVGPIVGPATQSHTQASETSREQRDETVEALGGIAALRA